jgi:phosphonatase-like hydrolase
MSNIKLVVFDMAGTTIKDQKEVENCFAQACKLSGLDVSQERILALQGYAKKEVFTLLWKEKIDENSKELERKIDYSYDIFCNILEIHYKSHPVLPTDFCLETLAWLRKNNIKIALTTGFYRKVSNIILNKVGWDVGLNKAYVGSSPKSIINFSCTPTETAKGRPAPDMIYKCMEMLHITDVKQVINIGDTPVDLASGKAAGVRLNLAVTNGTHSKSQLEVIENDGLLFNLSELKYIIENL